MHKNLSYSPLELYQAITDTENTAYLDVVEGPDTGIFFGRSNDFTEGWKGSNSIDLSDIRTLDAPSNNGGLPARQVIGHETLEAYESARLSDSSTRQQRFERSHNYANRSFPGLIGPVGGSAASPNADGRIPGGHLDFRIQGSQNNRIRVFVQFPVPVSANSTGNRANVIRVEKLP